MKYFSIAILFFSLSFIAKAQDKNIIENANSRTLLYLGDTIKVTVFEKDKIEYHNLLNTGNTYYLNKQYEMAISNFTKAIGLYPDNYMAYMNRSLVYSKMQEYEKALWDINNAIQLDSSNFLCYYNRGMIYHDAKQYGLGIADFTKAIELKNDASFSYLYLGECYIMSGDAVKAIQNFDTAIRLDPTNYEAYYSRSVYYSDFGLPKQQFKDLKKCIALKPNHLSALNNLGFYYKESKPDSAIYYFSMAIEVDGNNLKSRANRARAYENKKEYQKAIEDLSHAISILPTEKYFYQRRYEVYTKMGQKEKAQRDLEMYDKLNKN